MSWFVIFLNSPSFLKEKPTPPFFPGSHPHPPQKKKNSAKYIGNCKSMLMNLYINSCVIGYLLYILNPSFFDNFFFLLFIFHMYIIATFFNNSCLAKNLGNYKKRSIMYDLMIISLE